MATSSFTTTAYSGGFHVDNGLYATVGVGGWNTMVAGTSAETQAVTDGLGDTTTGHKRTVLEISGVLRFTTDGLPAPADPSVEGQPISISLVFPKAVAPGEVWVAAGEVTYAEADPHYVVGYTSAGTGDFPFRARLAGNYPIGEDPLLVVLGGDVLNVHKVKPGIRDIKAKASYLEPVSTTDIDARLGSTRCYYL